MLLHTVQKRIVISLARFKIVRAGRRSGKTVTKSEVILFKAVAKIIKLTRDIKNRSVIFIAPTQKQARTIIWEVFRNRLKGVGDFNESRLEIRLPTEDGGVSTIFIGGWENRENYRGMPNVVHIEFDEIDTMKDFFIGWIEIFRPMLIDTGGSAGFGGTPKKENPNLRRLENEAKDNPEWESFHFTTADNPYVSTDEIEKARLEMDDETYKQEILAEYVDNTGALFRYDALVDVFTNTIVKQPNKRYMIVDVADDGSDKTVFSFWDNLEESQREEFSRLSTEMIIQKIREYCAQYRIPMSHVAVDAIGVGSAVASNSLLDGIIGFKSSFAPIKTDHDIIKLPNVSYTKVAPLVSDYKNLRSQCVFLLAEKVNTHAIASKCVGRQKEVIIEQLSQYQDASQGDGKRMATPKEKVKEAIGHSPDDSDTWIMRMFFEIKERMVGDVSLERESAALAQRTNIRNNQKMNTQNSSK